MAQDVSKGNTYRYLLPCIDVASRYKVAKLLITEKSSELAFVLGASYRKCANFKYSILKIQRRYFNAIMGVSLKVK